MPVIRISDSVYKRLQKYATPFEDSPGDVVERLLDRIEGKQTRSGMRSNSQSGEIDPSLGFDPEAEQDSEDQPNTASWSGFWFVNVGEHAYSGEHTFRDWDDCAKYGFLAAARKRRTDQLKKLLPGSKVFAYLAGYGYVGYGEVVREACPAKEFIPEGYTESILDLQLQAENMAHDPDDLDRCEWVVGVKWHTTFTRDEAKWDTGLFAKQRIACRLLDEETLDFLRREFNVSD